MRKPFAILAIIAMLFGPSSVRAAATDDHLVPRGAAGARLADAATERAHNLATVDKAFSTPLAGKAAAKAGLNLRWIRNGLPQLSDRDLSDLSQRAAALNGDPVAGHYYEHDAVDALVLVMVFAAIAIIVIEVANHY